MATLLVLLIQQKKPKKLDHAKRITFGMRHYFRRDQWLRILRSAANGFCDVLVPNMLSIQAVLFSRGHVTQQQHCLLSGSHGIGVDVLLASSAICIIQGQDGADRSDLLIRQLRTSCLLAGYVKGTRQSDT